MPCCSFLQVDRGHSAVLHHPPHPGLQRDRDGPGGIRALQAGGPKRLRVPRRSRRQVSPGVSIFLGAGGGCCHLTPPTPPKNRRAKPREGPGAGRVERLLKPPPAPAGLGEAAPPWEPAAPAPRPRCPAHPTPAGPSQAGWRARAREGAAGLQPAGHVLTSLSARSGLQSRRRRLLSLFQRRGPGFPVLLAPHPPGFHHLPGWGQHPDAGLQELGQPGDL